jgi:hypothetical protein
MSLLRNLADGLRSLFRKERVDREFDEELSAFLEMAAQEKMKHGMSGKDALRTVRLERGNLEVTKEVVRSAGRIYASLPARFANPPASPRLPSLPSHSALAQTRQSSAWCKASFCRRCHITSLIDSS